MKLDLKNAEYGRLGHFRFRKIKDRILLTNEIGWYVFVTEQEFQGFIQGTLDAASPTYQELHEKGFIRNEAAIESMARAYAKKNHFLFRGPSLHIFVLTGRCNNKCLYCHASAHGMAEQGLDMSKEVAEQSLQIAFESPNRAVTIEFQGGEPLVNWEVLQFVIERAQLLSRQKAKDLELRLVTNLNLMTEEKFDYLIAQRVFLTTSLDGPQALHDQQRPLLQQDGAVSESSYANVTHWIEYFNGQLPMLRKQGYARKINALPTITRQSLDKPIEIIGEYVKLGMGTIKIAPLNPFGFSKKAWQNLGYSAAEYVEFYKRSLDHILELNKRGVRLTEVTAMYYLKKILAEHDPNMFEMRSPCGAGIGQISYNYDGQIYTCDEGRMLGEMHDDAFLLGNVDDAFEKLMDNTTTKSLCAASCLIGASGCEDCAYLPYCGTCPVYNYAEQGNILGQMPTNERCRISKATLDYLFGLMQEESNLGIFKKWIANK